jgi:hypothetical protein
MRVEGFALTIAYGSAITANAKSRPSLDVDDSNDRRSSARIVRVSGLGHPTVVEPALGLLFQ